MSNGNKRPTAALVLGILNIVFGVLSICTGFFGLLSQIAPGARKPEIPPDVQSWMHILQVVGLMLSIVLIVSGIGLLFVKNWGRLLAIVYAIVDIPVSLAGSVITAKTIEPILNQMNVPIPPDMHGPLVTVAIVGGICCGLIYPIVLLIVLNLKDVRAAFTRSLPPPVSPPNLGG